MLKNVVENLLKTITCIIFAKVIGPLYLGRLVLISQNDLIGDCLQPAETSSVWLQVQLSMR